MPATKLREEYADEVKVIEANIKDIANGTAPQELYQYSQSKLDNLANRFQENEKIGTARYKLYELQALLYYFQNRDEDALVFIQQAIEVKGASYKRAEQLIRQINVAPADTPTQAEYAVAEEHLTKEEKRRRLIGIEGWLALFVLGQFLALIFSVVGLLSNNLSSSDVDTFNKYQYGLGDELQALITFENIAIVVYIILVIATTLLIFSRQKLAKPVAVTTLTYGVIYGGIDYAVASSIFDSANLTQYVQSELSDYASDVGRSVLGAIIWIPYFLKSKRVKATLTR